jgi:hypothetical protein
MTPSFLGGASGLVSGQNSGSEKEGLLFFSGFIVLVLFMAALIQSILFEEQQTERST